MGLEKDEALESLLVNIRSVVLSSKGGVLLSQLQADYRKYIGTCIPFEKFGYESLESLLLDAADCISVKKNSNGQLYAEAVTDSSTAHLSSLISRQKKIKVKKDPKPKFLKKNSCSICRSKQNDVASATSNSSTSSKSADEKDQEIEDLKNRLESEKTMNEELAFEVGRLQTQLKVANKALQSERSYITRQNYQQAHPESEVKEIQDMKMRLEKEMRINKGYSSEVERFSSLLMRSEDLLRVEKANVQKLKEQLKSLQTLAEGKSKNDSEIDALMKVIEELNSKLEKEKKITRDYSSQIIRLNSSVKIFQDSLSAEKDTVKKLKSQIDTLQSLAAKETSPVYEHLNSSSNSKEKCKTLQNLSRNDPCDGVLNFQEIDSATQSSKCNSLSSISEQHPLMAAFKSYENGMSEQMQKFENRLNKQNKKLLLLEKTQQSHYTKLDNKIKNCSDALNIEYIIQRVLEHPQFLESSNFYASNNNLCPSMPSITPTSSQSDNDSEQSYKATSVPAITRGKYGPPGVEAYRKNWA